MVKVKYLSLLVIFIIFFGCAKTREEKSLKMIDDNLTIRLEGIVSAGKNEKVLANVGGYVKKIYVQNGDKVKKGDKIYELNKELLYMDIKKLKQDIKKSERLKNDLKYQYSSISAINLSAIELKKVAFLHSKGYVSDFEEDSYKRAYITNLSQLKNNKVSFNEKIEALNSDIADKKYRLEKLNYALKHNNAVAPINGFITNLNISKNQLISANQVVCNIIDIDEVVIKAGLAPGLLPFVHKGQKVRINFVTSPSYSMISEITNINPIIDSKFQTMTIKIKAKNKNYILQNGTRALISIYLPKNSQKQVKEMFETEDRLIQIPSAI